MENLNIHTCLHAKLHNGNIIHGLIEDITESGFIIDDDIACKMIKINFSEVKEVFGIY